MRHYFSTAILIKAFFIASLFSAFIYLAHFGFHAPWLNTLLGLAALYGLTKAEQKTVALSGFFIGIFWFYWISFSFRYYGHVYIIPLVILVVGLIYGLIFWFLGFLKNPFARGAGLFLLGFIHPVGFNWLKPELLFVESILGTAWWQFALILTAVAILANFAKKWRLVAIIPLVLALDISRPQSTLPEIKIHLAQTKIPQEIKWDKSHLDEIIAQNLLTIDKAALEGFDLVVLPESSFPLFLNHEPFLLGELKAKSHRIAIVTGALHLKGDLIYNSTYFFDNGEFQIADKVVLVPFGEYVPLPKFLGRIINDIFFDGAQDYEMAQNPTDFTIKGERFRNAICYEATTDTLYQGNPRYMIAISNNAWFAPSIEPTLQSLLLRYYARKYRTVIFHCTNHEKTGIITP